MGGIYESYIEKEAAMVRLENDGYQKEAEEVRREMDALWLMLSDEEHRMLDLRAPE